MVYARVMDIERVLWLIAGCYGALVVACFVLLVVAGSWNIACSTRDTVEAEEGCNEKPERIAAAGMDGIKWGGAAALLGALMTISLA